MALDGHPGSRRKRGLGGESLLRPLFPLIALTTVLPQGASIGAPRAVAVQPQAKAAQEQTAQPLAMAAQPQATAASDNVIDTVPIDFIAVVAACANPVVLATWQNTHVHWAACDRDPTALGLLIKAGANLRQMNMGGLTPLQLAAYANPNPVATQLLLDAGVEVDTPNHRGETALHLAARYNPSLAVLEALLHAGADPGAVTDNGQTAWDLAKENPHAGGHGALDASAP